MKLFPMQALQAAGIDKGAASIIAGTAMGVFAGLLALGLLYAWRKRVLRWV